MLKHDEAFRCINKILLALDEPSIDKKEFDKSFLNTESNDYEQITEDELISFISKHVHRQEILLVSLYWVGWSLKPDSKKNFQQMKTKAT